MTTNPINQQHDLHVLKFPRCQDEENNVVGGMLVHLPMGIMSTLLKMRKWVMPK
jgi:hypothetical protein